MSDCPTCSAAQRLGVSQWHCISCGDQPWGYNWAKPLPFAIVEDARMPRDWVLFIGVGQNTEPAP